MRPDDLREWLLALPLRPFRLFLVDGATYEIHHSELAIIKRSTVDLHFSAAHPRAVLAEREVTIALLHITRIEALPATAPPVSNGG